MEPASVLSSRTSSWSLTLDVTEAFLLNPRGMMPHTRREFIVRSALLTGAGAAAAMGPLFAPESAEKRKPFRIAMINSEYRFKSHGYHLGRRFMEGYDRKGFIISRLRDKYEG